MRFPPLSEFDLRGRKAPQAGISIRTLFDGPQATIIIRRAGQEDFEPQRYCGDSWCTGQCGLPALVLDVKGRELKCHSSVVACGPVWQHFRNKWTGEKVEYLPADGEDRETLAKMIWW